MLERFLMLLLDRQIAKMWRCSTARCRLPGLFPRSPCAGLIGGDLYTMILLAINAQLYAVIPERPGQRRFSSSVSCGVLQVMNANFIRFLYI
jgi:hypothetical protein